MKRDKVIAALKALAPALHSRFGVKRLSLFGSHARDEAAEGSDIDVLVEFEGPATFDAYMQLKFHLEDALGCSVDLVTDKAVRRELRPYIEEDAIRVA